MAKIDDILIPGQNVNKLDLRKYLQSREIATPQDYGAYGDGIADDTAAINQALAEAKAVFLPPGTYRTTAPIVMGYGTSLIGVGAETVIQARDFPYDAINLPTYPSDFNAIEMQDGYSTVKDLWVVGGATGIFLAGQTGPCVKNVVENVTIWDTKNGITFDGWDDTNKPCYWNNVSRALIARPQINGVLFTVTPIEGNSGDTPNANKLHDVRVYSLSAPMSGSGFFLSAARFHNSFVDCEANVHPSAEACFRLGFSTDENRIVNFYEESLGLAPGIRIDNGSTNTSIVNLFSATGGAAIWDPTLHGEYQAYNAGFPTKNFLKKTWVEDLNIEALTFSTQFIDEPLGGQTVIDLNLKTTMYLVSSFNQPVELRLPNAADATGRVVRIKKTDFKNNPITITEIDGSGPDLREINLYNRYDTVTVISNGANWWVLADNLMPQNSFFVDSDLYPAGLFEPSMHHRLYVVSAFVRAMEIRLPAPAQAPGRVVTIKKNDPSGNAVTVTQDGGGGPDAQAQPLTQHFQGLTVMSDGGQWFILSRT
jgi:hypothetical protein